VIRGRHADLEPGAAEWGCGRTTLALILAVMAEARGERVLIVDLDPQRRCRFWAETRGTDNPTVIEAAADGLPEIIASEAQLWP
jgi:cellulose biosynthesis protein BcsQ